MTVTKAELAKHLFEKLGLNRHESMDLIRLFFDEIASALEHGKTVKISGFGNFVLHDKKQRIGRNPKTGQAIPISARRVVVFRPSQRLKNRVVSNARANADIATFSTDT